MGGERDTERGGGRGVTFNVEFQGVDRFNRPIFKDEKGNYYGSCDILFGYEASQEEVLNLVTGNDLLYFGRSFGCEPWGVKPKETPVIVWREQ